MKTAFHARQRGVALITAVLIVALATILAVNVGFNAYLDQRRSATIFSLDQGFEIALGAEAWAADILKRDRQGGGKVDDLTEEWAMPMPPIPVDGGEVAGYLEDMQGRFNLNSLVVVDGNGELATDPQAVLRFKNLLSLLEMEEKWADMIADWLDSDLQPGFPDGAEDSIYTSQTPGYRAANMRITRTSELLALKDFGIERYRRLEPFVSALPPGTSINVCTAPPEVLDALLGSGVAQFTRDRKNVAEMRKLRCFPELPAFQAQLDAKVKKEYEDGKVIGESSDYFRAHIWVTIGTTQFTLYSLLNRANGTNLSRPILRSFGTD